MDKWPQKYPTVCNCQASLHKFYKNCLNCGLVLCQQNAKLTECTFCGSSFMGTAFTSADSSLTTKLAAANALKDRLVAADSNSTSTALLDCDAPLTSVQFHSLSELDARREEFEALKAKMEEERLTKGTFVLSEMLFNENK